MENAYSDSRKKIHPDPRTNLTKLITQCMKACKCSYNIMIEKYSSIPTDKQDMWKLYLDTEDLQWNNIYKNCFKTFEEVKLRQFQYFFTQRITALPFPCVRRTWFAEATMSFRA